MAHLTNFSFEFVYKIFTEDASLPLLYHGAKKSKMTKTQIKGGCPTLGFSLWKLHSLTNLSIGVGRGAFIYIIWLDKGWGNPDRNVVAKTICCWWTCGFAWCLHIIGWRKIFTFCICMFLLTIFKGRQPQVCFLLGSGPWCWAKLYKEVQQTDCLWKEILTETSVVERESAWWFGLRFTTCQKSSSRGNASLGLEKLYKI